MDQQLERLILTEALQSGIGEGIEQLARYHVRRFSRERGGEEHLVGQPLYRRDDVHAQSLGHGARRVLASSARSQDPVPVMGELSLTSSRLEHASLEPSGFADGAWFAQGLVPVESGSKVGLSVARTDADFVPILYPSELFPHDLR
jgi:hypothetical protein